MYIAHQGVVDDIVKAAWTHFEDAAMQMYAVDALGTIASYGDYTRVRPSTHSHTCSHILANSAPHMIT